MTTITREQQKQILIDTANHVISRDNTSPYSENLRELARIALASLEAEPIGAFHIADQQVDGTSDYIEDGEWPIDNGIIEVYAAPPALQERRKAAAEPVLYAAGETLSYANMGELHLTCLSEPMGDAVIPLYAATPVPVVPDEKCDADGSVTSDFDHGWNACRAAMLQGSQPVTTPKKLTFEQWLSQQTGTIDVECGCVMTEVFFHWLRVAYEAGNYPQCLEISNSSTNNFLENAETSTKCWCHTCRPLTISDMRFVVCPECGNKRCPHANDHRNACTGSNEPGQEGSAYPAAPQQEAQ